MSYYTYKNVENIKLETSKLKPTRECQTVLLIGTLAQSNCTNFASFFWSQDRKKTPCLRFEGQKVYPDRRHVSVLHIYGITPLHPPPPPLPRGIRPTYLTSQPLTYIDLILMYGKLLTIMSSRWLDLSSAPSPASIDLFLIPFDSEQLQID